MRSLLVQPIRSLLERERRVVAQFVAATLVAATLPALSALLLYRFLAGVLGAQGGLAADAAQALGTTRAIWLLAALLLATFLATAGARFYAAVLQQRLVRIIELSLIERLLRHLLTLSIVMLDKQSPGDILEAVREDVVRVRSVIDACARMVLLALTGVTLAAVAVWLSPTMALLSFALLVPIVGPTLILTRRVRSRAVGVRRRAFRVFDDVLQMLRGIRIIKVYGGERAEAHRAVSRLRDYFAELVALARDQALGAGLLDSLGGLSVVVLVIVGGFEVLAGRLTWPALVAVLMALRSAQGPLAEFYTHALTLQRHTASIGRLDELLRHEPSPRDAVDALVLSEPLTSLAFDRVSYAYEPGSNVLTEISFRVERGDVLGIVGPSGAGKSTLLNLAARFVDPTSGVVRVNGHDARHVRLADLYAQIALVTQEPFLFSTTVGNNIRSARPDATDREIAAAAEAAGIHDEITQLPAGYDTEVGIGHRALSGGQSQRVNIARALLKNAPLLLLDEATAHLDGAADARVRTALARLRQGHITLVVAHRLATVRHATRILVLDRGHLLAQGTHDELLAGCLLYRQMLEAQALTPPDLVGSSEAKRTA